MESGVGEVACAALAGRPKIRGRWEIREELGRGGMGVVYRAHDADMDREVAIKTILPGVTGPPAEALFREARSAGRLSHPNIVPIFDVFEADGAPYLVMPLLEGETLQHYLASRSRLSPKEAIDLLLPVFGALDQAHERRIIHRDLKPANIFLRRGEKPEPVVLDFGIARALGADASARIATGPALFGTPRYMAPERASDRNDVGPGCDQFSLGVILYECVTGRHPMGDGFESLGPTGQLLMIAGGGVRPLDEASLPGAPPSFISAVNRMIEPSPARRFPRLRDAARAVCGDSLLREGIDSVDTVSIPGPASLHDRRRPTLVAATVLFVTLAGAIGALLIMRNRDHASASVPSVSDVLPHAPTPAEPTFRRQAVERLPDDPKPAGVAATERADDKSVPTRSKEFRHEARPRHQVRTSRVEGAAPRIHETGASGVAATGDVRVVPKQDPPRPNSTPRIE